MKILTVLGARPQFIKAAPLSRVLRKHHHEVLVHTGQHYDDNMSKIFFDELSIPSADYNLGVGSDLPGKQIGVMLIKLEEVLDREKPDWVLVYGDTNSTLAGSLAAVKQHIPVAHIEAGLRSYDWQMPVDINRVMPDHLSALLFCPAQAAVDNLAAESITKGVYIVGDVMFESLTLAKSIAKNRSTIHENLGLREKKYLLATIHRAENTDHPERLKKILESFSCIDQQIIFPVHPRTRKVISSFGLSVSQISNLVMIDPVGYLDMIQLESSAEKILTDSGGIQKEAYWLGVPCITLRDRTEWIETISSGWNVLVGDDPAKLIEAVRKEDFPEQQLNLYGDGKATQLICQILDEQARLLA
jgi:UDP-GlcNAc3NAcA epimerase